MVLTGWSITFWVVVVALVTLWTRKVISNLILGTTCATCKAQASEENQLMRCSECGQLFCRDGAEELVWTINLTRITIESKPSKKDVSFSCGTRLIRTEVRKGETEKLFCKKHSPRPPFHYEARRVS